MVTGWRRAFCTSIPKERETPIFTDKKQQQQCSSSSHSPRISSKFGFFSNPSTPRLQSQPVSSTPSLRCRTTTATTPTSSVPNSPKLQSKKSKSPRLFHFSNPSSPKSPSSFSLLKATLRLSKNRCGICLQSVKSGQGTTGAILTAECNHVFHFPCIATHVKKKHHQQNLLFCPLCNAHGKELPLISLHQNHQEIKKHENQNKVDASKIKNLRVYNDDEPLLSPSPGSLFNPIPENEFEEEEDTDNDIPAQEFQGFFVNPTPPVLKPRRNVELSLLPESAVVTAGRTYQTHVVVLRIRAPPYTAARRPPIDLVMVLDVSQRMCGVKLQVMKRIMRVVMSSLNSNDRLSIVAFSATSKRLSPLKRMTADGRRSARRIIDALGSTGQGMSANDALKKAAKVIEDRRVKNPVASIIIISNGQDDRSHINSVNQKMTVSSTRFSHLEIPVHSVSLDNISVSNHAPLEDAIAKSIAGLLSVSVQELKLQLGFVSSGSSQPLEISAVYSLTGRTNVFSPGSVRLGDLHGEEEKELLVELKGQASAGSHHMLSVRSSFKDPSSQEIVLCKEQALLLPRPQAVRSSLPNIQRLRDLHVSTRALAESRRLIDYYNDLSGAYHLLSSARALLMQSSDGSGNEYVRGLEVELGELNMRRQHSVQSQRQRSGQQIEEKPEPLTPTSAWRAAERLAKVAIMRKHMNRVSDLHGFENARF
ncbi:protein binding protein, putative [Ricinus communis]|uniref:Protein binding protein, putative n=1 Tax=Ricinus communis TaxID=3988 RepID=B9SSC8_RICCO|nr:protein binding protein, putative [Ricinus communis]|eukprot:XP_002528897.1 probable E3 ubiquitin-protein ligase EDA40 [Ricinus communis]